MPDYHLTDDPPTKDGYYWIYTDKLRLCKCRMLGHTYVKEAWLKIGPNTLPLTKLPGAKFAGPIQQPTLPTPHVSLSPRS